jgi:hypothetical protein
MLKIKHLEIRIRRRNYIYKEMKNKLNSRILVTILIPFRSPCLASENTKSSLKTISSFAYMDVKLGISSQGENIDEAVLGKFIRIFGPKECSRNLEVIAQ